MQIQPVILCGGAGSRLWPLSRREHPKQLLPLMDEYSLLQNTVQRLEGLQDVLPPIVVCNEHYRFLVKQQLVELGLDGLKLILEPLGKNTAPAIALAAHATLEGREAFEANDECALLVLPSDHVIEHRDAFHRAIGRALPLAEQGNLVTFGITALTPETGYGYIQRGAALEAGFAIERFVEKPSQAVAAEYLATGEYYWNSGMFVFTAQDYLARLTDHAPDLARQTQESWRNKSIDDVFIRPEIAAWSAAPAESIDYAVMEHETRAAVVPLDAGWSDVGSWQALWNIGPKDDLGNSHRGDVLLQESRDCLVVANERLVGVIGLEQIVVVETADAVLVTHASQSQKVKDLVHTLEAEDREEHLVHTRVQRPWGWYQTVDRGPKHHTKRIQVFPGERLSLQRHEHRAEHWVVVTGHARVTCESRIFELGENESTFIPKGAKHRLENMGTTALEIVEVQSGDYLGEDDIVRYEDAYGRLEDEVRFPQPK